MENLIDETPVNAKPEKQPWRGLQRGRMIVVQEGEAAAEINGIQVFQPGE